MQPHERILLENKAWSQEMIQRNPKFFSDMAKVQTPSFLWIGCSDSRVSPTEISQTKPGELFIHRNVANMVVENDINLLSVMQYAVEVLKVDNIIVCGHYGCGGVRASMGEARLGLIDNWLAHIKTVYRTHSAELDAIENDDARADRLVELNVMEQLINIANTPLIQKAWAEGNRPHLSGWVYSIADGLIRPKYEMNAGDARPMVMDEPQPMKQAS